jgi:hypothetical protein
MDPTIENSQQVQIHDLKLRKLRGRKNQGKKDIFIDFMSVWRATSVQGKV